MLRSAALFVAVLLLAPLASGQHLRSGSFDPQTGEPIPLGGTPPEPQAAPAFRGGGTLEVLAHLPEGSTKLVRVTDDDLVVFQNGADLVAGSVEDDGGAAVFAEAGRYRLEGQPTDMVIVGSLAYVTLQKNEGLLVLDLSDPAAITAAGQLEGTDLFAVAVQGDYAYVGKGTAGLAVYDVSDLGAITEVAALDTPGSANGLAVSGTTLYVADGNNSSGPDFRTYDVSDPTNPQLLGTYEAGGFVTYVLVDGGVAYLAGAFGLHTLDVSDPASPTFLGSFDAGGDTTYEIDLSQGEQSAYLAGLAGAFAVDVSDPANPVAFQSFTDSGQGLGIALLTTDDFLELALFADRFEGLRILDASLRDGDQLPQIGFVENGGFSHKGTFDGGYLYVTDLAGTLRIIDLGAAVPGGSGPIEEVGRIDVPANTQEVLVRGGLAYVTDADFGGTGLTIVDVSDPANPSIVGSYGNANQVFGLDLVGDVLYLAHGFSGLVTLDVSDPANPVPLGAFPMASNTVDVVVDPDTDVAYVVNFGGGMYSLDVSDPASPVQLDAEVGWGFLNAISFGQRYTDPVRQTGLVADGQAGLRVVDMTDPSALSTVNTYPTASQARDVAGTALLALTRGAFFDAAAVADDFFGLRVFLNDGSAFGSLESADRGIGVAYLGPTEDEIRHLIALAAGETGVYFVEGPITVVSETETAHDAFRLAAVTPNPARGAATVRYALPEAGPVTLAVYDLLGRRVATLAEGTQAAGAHEARLDAARLPSGVYVVRLAAGGRVLTTKATVVR